MEQGTNLAVVCNQCREFASQISGKKVKQSNPKAVVDVEIDTELVHPKVNVEFSKGFGVW